MTRNMTDEEIDWAVEQIILWSDNDHASYDRKLDIFKNLDKKKARGIYDPMKAEIAINYLTTDIRRELNREMKENIVDMIGGTMPPIISACANKIIMEEYEEGSWR